MKKFTAMLLILCLLLGLFAGCTKQETAQADQPAEEAQTEQPAEQTQAPEEAVEPEEAESADGQTRIFVDSLGREVEVPAEIDAVAPSGSIAQMIIYTLCWEKMIALSTEFTELQATYFREECTELPVLGRFYGGGDSISFEGLIAAAPDVIIDVGEVKDGIEEDMQTLQERTGIPVVYIESTLQTLPETYRMLGDLLGEEEDAAALSAYVEDVLALAEENRAKLTAETTHNAAFVQGEFGLGAFAAGTDHSEVLEVVGVENVAVLDEFTSKGGDDVSMEQMLLWDPEILLISTGSNFDTIYDDPQWQSISAVQNGEVYEVPEGPNLWLTRPPCVQRVLGILWLGNLVYPELYDFDMVEKTVEFFDLFWDYDLSEDQAREMLANSTLLKAE